MRQLIADAEFEQKRRMLMAPEVEPPLLKERCDCCRAKAYVYGFSVKGGKEMLCKYHWSEKIKFDNIGVAD